MTYKIEIKYSTVTNQWHGNIIAPNGRIVYTQEPVHNMSDAVSTAKGLTEHGFCATIEVHGKDGRITTIQKPTKLL